MVLKNPPAKDIREAEKVRGEERIRHNFALVSFASEGGSKEIREEETSEGAYYCFF